MGILKRSKKSILGLDEQLGNIETNVSNNSINLSTETTRSTTAEDTLTLNLNNVTATVAILNADVNTTGSVEKKIAEATAPLAGQAVTYTKTEVDTVMATKIDSTLALSTVSVGNKVVTQTELNLKANSSDVYTTLELDTSLSGKADASATYNKTEVDSLVAGQANAADVYTKTETDNLVSPKANSADVYTTTQSDTALGNKINTTDTVTAITVVNKVVTQTELATKANTVDVYTQTAVDTALGNKINTTDTVTALSVGNKVVTEAELSTKANTADVYTQTQIDTALGLKADAITTGKIGASAIDVDETNKSDNTVLVFNMATNKFAYEAKPTDGVNGATGNTGSNGLDGAQVSDVTITTASTWSSDKINSELTLKATATNVYTKTEADALHSAASQGLKYSVTDITALNALTGMTQENQALVGSDRYVYKYDVTNGWIQFYAMDSTHNHDDFYYTETEMDASLLLKANASTTYSKVEVDGMIADETTNIGKIGASLKVVNETNIADGYILSYNSISGELEYVAKPTDGVNGAAGDTGLNGTNGTNGTQANDIVIAPDTTWSSNKINTELALKADGATTYTKTEVDNADVLKVNVSDVKTVISGSNKIVTESDVAGLAPTSNVYTKTQIDTSLDGKVNVSDVLTVITIANKVVTQDDIVGKADISSVYTKTVSDTNLALKANATDVYTQSEIDTSMGGKLNTTDSVTTISSVNKIVTQNEIAGFTTRADTYTKTEVDNLDDTKLNLTDSFSTVSVGNKLITETEMTAKVNVTDVKTAISVGNKVVTESDITAAIDSNNATLATAPILAVDRPTLRTKSSSGLDYVFVFSLSKTPHGSLVVNDEITIYNFDVNGAASLFEGVTLNSDKTAEIAVTLAQTGDESKYIGKTVKVCYLTTETIVTPGTDESHPIIINTGVVFELQGFGTTSYAIDFNVGKFYQVLFTDGVIVSVVHDTTHLAHNGFHVQNTSTDFEAELYLTQARYDSDFPTSCTWVGFVNNAGNNGDEAAYISYNWIMELTITSGLIYSLDFTQGIASGGGAL